MNVDNDLESGLIPDARRIYYCHPELVEGNIAIGPFDKLRVTEGYF